MNILVILKRTGDQWRDLSLEEYAKERAKDGGYQAWAENEFFNQVQPFTVSADTAATVCDEWAKINQS